MITVRTVPVHVCSSYPDIFPSSSTGWLLPPRLTENICSSELSLVLIHSYFYLFLWMPREAWVSWHLHTFLTLPPPTCGSLSTLSKALFWLHPLSLSPTPKLQPLFIVDLYAQDCFPQTFINFLTSLPENPIPRRALESVMGLALCLCVTPSAYSAFFFLYKCLPFFPLKLIFFMNNFSIYYKTICSNVCWISIYI